MSEGIVAYFSGKCKCIIVEVTSFFEKWCTDMESVRKNSTEIPCCFELIMKDQADFVLTILWEIQS